MAWAAGFWRGRNTATVMVSLVTPWCVMPPLSPLKAGTHAGALLLGILMRPVTGSQLATSVPGGSLGTPVAEAADALPDALPAAPVAPLMRAPLTVPPLAAPPADVTSVPALAAAGPASAGAASW